MGLEVQNCCCCFKLETGAKIISIFEIIGGFLLLIGGVAGLGSDPLVGSYVLFEGLVALIGGVFLLLGVLKNKANYLLPFLVLCFVGIITYAIGFIADLYKAVAGSGKQDGSKVASGIVSEIVAIALCLYFFVVIYSLFKQMKGTSSNNAGVA